MVLDLASRVDGLVVLGRTVGDDVLADLAGKGMPLVLMARDPIPGADAVNAENAQSAYDLTTHLAADQGWQHVLDPAYASVLAGPELALRAHLDQLVADRAVLEGGGAWPAVEAMLRRFGWTADADGVGPAGSGS